MWDKSTNQTMSYVKTTYDETQQDSSCGSLNSKPRQPGKEKALQARHYKSVNTHEDQDDLFFLRKVSIWLASTKIKMPEPYR